MRVERYTETGLMSLLSSLGSVLIKTMLMKSLAETVVFLSKQVLTTVACPMLVALQHPERQLALKRSFPNPANQQTVLRISVSPGGLP